MPTPPSSHLSPTPVLATAIHLGLAAQRLSPKAAALLIYPRPGRPAPDAKASLRRLLSAQLTALNSLHPHPDDTGLDIDVALALDRLLGFPIGYTALLETLETTLRSCVQDAEFLRRIPYPTKPAPGTAAYCILTATPQSGILAFIDGRFPPGYGSFPAEP